MNNVPSAANEISDGALVGQKLRTPLQSTGDPAKDEVFRQGGYQQRGYGVTVGAAIDGSFALEGNQGYYTASGQKIFIDTVNAMKTFFARHRQKGKAIRYIIKTGIGGQHTPFQGIADGFSLIDAKTGVVVGEYELGKNFDLSIAAALKAAGAGWDELTVIPSSKSGSTDETMVIFVQILAVVIKQAFIGKNIDSLVAEKLTQGIMTYLRGLNVDKDGKEQKELFKGFSFDTLKSSLSSIQAVERTVLVNVFKQALGHMFFETTDNPKESRLSAFIRNSGLDKELGDDKPGFGAMFENVGGRWTADLHMMTFLAFHNLDAMAYWQERRNAIQEIRDGKHQANQIAHKMLDEGITDIALLVPDVLFWFGKSNEQNFNESIWQPGFANLITVPESLWDVQKQHYLNKPGRVVLNLSSLTLGAGFTSVNLGAPNFNGKSAIDMAKTYANLFSLFYGITNTVGNRLIGRAIRAAGLSPESINLSDLENPATQIVQKNLFLRQPFVELGKRQVDKRFQDLQAKERAQKGAIAAAMKESQAIAVQSDLALTIKSAMAEADASGRKFVPFLYIEGDKFQTMRIALTKMGIEWVLQGTGDQHISYQQVLAQPQKYFVMIVSFLPETGQELEGMPAVGFSKAHLDQVSPNLLRDYFAEASYSALINQGPTAKGLFLRLKDDAVTRQQFLEAMKGPKKQLVL